jgi:S-formylglutathione hydrolase FrmB
MRWARRAFALGALAAVVVAGWAIARATIWPDQHGAADYDLSIDSNALHRRAPVWVVVPSGGGQARPLLVWLHGRNGDQHSERHNGAMYAALEKLGKRAPVIVFPSGGGSSYWHDRRTGDWGRWVWRDVIPAVQRRFHTDRKRLAIGGISMGGYGAFDIARLHPGRLCAIGGHSPAIWRTGGETAPGAFDDAADFARHDIVGVARRRPGLFVGPRVWLDAGRKDPFQPGDRAFVTALRHAHVPISAHLTWDSRGHEHAYWQAHWGDYLTFYGRAFTHCR